jgi:hypothetical protein
MTCSIRRSLGFCPPHFSIPVVLSRRRHTDAIYEVNETEAREPPNNEMQCKLAATAAHEEDWLWNELFPRGISDISNLRDLPTHNNSAEPQEPVDWMMLALFNSFGYKDVGSRVKSPTPNFPPLSAKLQIAYFPEKSPAQHSTYQTSTNYPLQTPMNTYAAYPSSTSLTLIFFPTP